MVSFVAALALLGFGQDLKKPITYVCPGYRLEAALAELTPLAGVRLRGSSVTGREIVFLRLDNAPLDETMKRIADICAGEWQREADGGYILVRTPAIERLLREAEYNRRLAGAQKALDRLRETLAKSGEFTTREADGLAMQMNEIEKRQGNDYNFDDGSWRAAEKVRNGMPFARAAQRLALALDAQALASLVPGERVVFSTSPNRMQRRMPGQVQGAIDQLVREQKLFAEAVQRIGTPKGNNGMIYFMPSTKRAISTPAKVLLKVSSARESDRFTLEAFFVNENGKSLGRANTNFAAEDDPFRNDFLTQQGKGERIELDEQTLALGAALKPMVGSPDRNTKVVLPPGFVDKVLHPEQFEPLAMTAGPVLEAYAKAKKTNLVARLDDQTGMYTVWALLADKPTVDTFDLVFNRFALLEAKDGWTTLQPRGRGSQANLDRSVLGTLVRAAASGQRLSIDQRAAIAMKQDPNVEIFETILPLWLMFATGSVGAVNQSDDMQALRLYGSLSADQKQGLKAGRAIPFAQLSSNQLAVISKMVFQGYGGLQREWDEADMKEYQQQNEDGGVILEDDLRNEPTEILPNGLPPTATLSMTFLDRDGFFPDYAKTDRNVYESGEPVDANGLAWTVAAKERPDLFAWAANQPVAQGFWRGHDTRITMEMKFIPKVSMSRQLRDTSIDKRGKPLTLAELPDDFRKQYEASLKQYRESFKDMKPGDPGFGPGRNIPPR